MLRSRARRCSMRLPRRNISPLSGVSKPAISRSVVLLPLPEGPSRTRLSPSPMEKLTSSRTCSEPNHLLKPRTITDCRALSSGAAQARVACKESTISPAISYLALSRGEWGMGSGEWGRFQRSTPHSPFPTPHSRLLFQSLPRKQYQREDRNRDRRQHSRDRVRAFEIALIESGIDVKRRGLRLHRQIAADNDRRAELSDRAREGQQRAGDYGAAQGRQHYEAERLPPRRAHRLGGVLVTLVQVVQRRFDDAERQRESDEDVGQDDRGRREHDLVFGVFQKLSKQPAAPPHQQQRGARDGGRNRRRQTDDDHERRAALEFVLAHYPGRNQSEHDVAQGRHAAGGQTQLEGKDRGGRNQRLPEVVQSLAESENKDRGQRQNHQRRHRNQDEADADGPRNIPLRVRMIIHAAARRRRCFSVSHISIRSRA